MTSTLKAKEPLALVKSFIALLLVIFCLWGSQWQYHRGVDRHARNAVIQDRIASEQSTQSDLNKRKTALQDKLVGVQARYTAQYASLDALLFKLQGTSDSLKSALDGLTNSQKNN